MPTKTKVNRPTHSVQKVVDSYRKDGDEYDTEVTEQIGAAWAGEKVITIKIERDHIVLKNDVIKLFKL